MSSFLFFKSHIQNTSTRISLKRKHVKGQLPSALVTKEKESKTIATFLHSPKRQLAKILKYSYIKLGENIEQWKQIHC